MPRFSIALNKSAIRHFNAAETLFNKNSKDVAGYLYGISAECAVKEIMRRSGIYPLSPESKASDPFYAHFPYIKSLLVNRMFGRYSQVLQSFTASRFMNEWDISMRYAPATDIDDKSVDRWREHAIEALRAMNS